MYSVSSNFRADFTLLLLTFPQFCTVYALFTAGSYLPSIGDVHRNLPQHTPMVLFASYITNRPLIASAMRGFLSNNTLPIFRASLYTLRLPRILPRQNLSAGDFHPRISRRLRFEIVRHRVDHNRPPDNFRNCKPIRQKA